MLRAIKYELKPNSFQREMINKTCGCVRLIYNTMLDKKIKAYEKDKSNLSSYELIKELPQLKKEKEFLKEVPSQALQQAILNLDSAFNNFFKNLKNKEKVGFPKFKKKALNDSFRIPYFCEIDFDKWLITLPKMGQVKIYRGHNKTIEGKIKQYTVKHTNTDRYFISILYETDLERCKCNNGVSVGIDLGIKNFAILSDGKVFEN